MNAITKYEELGALSPQTVNQQIQLIQQVMAERRMSRPPSGTMVYWRFKKNVPGPWFFGYVTYEKGYELLRMGSYNGDCHGGKIVSASEVEWKPYKN